MTWVYAVIGGALAYFFIFSTVKWALPPSRYFLREWLGISDIEGVERVSCDTIHWLKEERQAQLPFNARLDNELLNLTERVLNQEAELDRLHQIINEPKPADNKPTEIRAKSWREFQEIANR